ncbi:MAG: hypothetical protein E7000_01750 [Coriobacteriaceae bacterium]|nr:hypothetical protein [Coriobacteriaceae bacterium]
MFGVRELNVSIELWGVAFCLIAIVSTLLFARFERRYHWLIVAQFSMMLVAAGGDAIAGIFRGQSGAFAWAATHIGNFATFAGSFLLLALFTWYLNARLEQAGGRIYPRWCLIVSAVSIVMCICAGAGVFYSIDVVNVYHRDDLFWVSIAHALVVDAVNAVIIIRDHRKLGATAFICLLFNTLAPMLAAYIQAFVYGLNFVMVAGVIGLVIIFLEMNAYSARMYIERTEQLAQAQTEAAESRIAVMVSQIQPHFLFNTLDTIYGLCDEDVELTKEAIASFSRYLRTNLNSLKRTTPVPITMEMEHVRTYLELERTSDESRLTYELDIQDADFSVPALSVETMVENAVKHGLGERERGGSVIVRTRELPDEHTVTIIDDGVGFDVDATLATTDRVGIVNTQSRLTAMCGGTLELNSTPGHGTTAVLHIPKKEDEA